MLITEYRLELAIQALRAILPLAHPADTTLRYFFKNERIGSNERELVAETVFGVLRHRLLLEHTCAGNATPRRMALAWLVRFGGYNLREIEPVLKRDEKEWLATVKGVKAEELPLPVQAELPEWLGKDAYFPFRCRYSRHRPVDAARRAAGYSRQHLLASEIFCSNCAAKILKPLPRHTTHRHPPQKTAQSRRAVHRRRSVGPSSQLLGFLLAPRRNDMVVDFCAGAGGKTLMLSALMNSQGRLYAMDVSEKRLANLKPRLKRSGASNIQPMLISHENDLKVKRLAGKIDRVLVDAPCSGLGTLRRSPDLKFRQSPGSIEKYTQQQAAILASASRLLKNGGRLVYATCSFLPEENQHIVQAFLAAHPDFALRPVSEILQQQKIALDTGDYLELRPHLHGTDGFFAAVMERV